MNPLLQRVVGWVKAVSPSKSPVDPEVSALGGFNDQLVGACSFATVFVETSSRCNLKCVYCNRTKSSYPSKNKDMSFECFKAILENIESCKVKGQLSHKPNVYLHGYGEPTLNKDFSRIIEAAKASDLFSKIHFVSNFTMRSDREYLEYFSRGADVVYVSIDSLRPEVVEVSRVGTSLAKMQATLEGVCKVYSDRITAITVLQDLNALELGDIYHYLRRNGIKKWNIQLLNTFESDFCLPKFSLDKLYEELPKDEDFTINFEGFPRPKCSQPFDTLVINVEGDIVPCCTDFTRKIGFYGNISDGLAASVFNGSSAQAFRRSFRLGAAEGCKSCPYYSK